MGKSIDEIADERASRYAPLPKYEPFYAGLVGLFITAIPLTIFMAIAKLDQDQFALPLGITLALGFALPATYFWNEKRKHYNAWSREYETLRKSSDA